MDLFINLLEAVIGADDDNQWQMALLLICLLVFAVVFTAFFGLMAPVLT